MNTLSSLLDYLRDTRQKKTLSQTIAGQTTVEGALSALNNNFITTREDLSTDAVSGEVFLVRCGKVRQLTFNDAQAPSAGVITIPTMSANDRPLALTQSVLRRNDGASPIIWVRTNGTFGWTGTTSGAVYNGTLTWVTA